MSKTIEQQFFSEKIYLDIFYFILRYFDYKKSMFLCKDLVWICTQFYFKQMLSLPLYSFLFETKPYYGCVPNFISWKGYEQNGKFYMFRYKDMLC